MIRGLAHVCFVVKDLDRSLAFYRDKLGLTPAFDFTNDKGERFGVYLSLGGRTFIELFVGKPDAVPANATYKHLCIEVDDVPKTAAELQSRGVEVTGLKLGADQSWQAWIADPDGNKIELMGYTPQSRQNPWLK